MRKLQGEEKDHKTLVLFKKLRSHTNEEQVMQIFSHVLLQLVICCCRNSDLTSAVAVNAYVKSWIKRRNEREALTGHHCILLLVFLKIGYFKKASEMCFRNKTSTRVYQTATNHWVRTNLQSQVPPPEKYIHKLHWKFQQLETSFSFLKRAFSL